MDNPKHPSGNYRDLTLSAFIGGFIIQNIYFSRGASDKASKVAGVSKLTNNRRKT